MTEKPIMITVAQDGTGDFASIGAALEHLEGGGPGRDGGWPVLAPGGADLTSAGADPTSAGAALISAGAALTAEKCVPAFLYIKNGIYDERLEIRRPFLTLCGESSGGTVITGNLYARMPMEGMGRRGTFRSYSVLVDTHDFTARNLTIENRAGRGDEVGQAIALYADGDRIFLEGCRLLGSQDTLFTGPLPPRELEKDGFIGPKQHSPRINGRHYYKDCFICGDIDFLFGSATAYFEGCSLYSLDRGKEMDGYVTASSTPEGQEYGYVFRNCRFTGNCPPHSVYLGRPWREYARTVLLECYLDVHIRPEGWHDWEKKEAHDTILCAEYASTGPGACDSSRPGWVTILTQEQALHYARQSVLGGGDGWKPWKPGP